MPAILEHVTHKLTNTENGENLMTLNLELSMREINEQDSKYIRK
jgi:hypothetical protein